MPSFLFQVSYTPEAWSALLKNPQDRTKAVAGPIEKLGGRAPQFWMSFGDYDIVGIVDMPDSVSAAAFSLALSAGGACKAVKTTPLITIAEGVEAMRKAAACGYAPVSKPPSA